MFDYVDLKDLFDTAIKKFLISEREEILDNISERNNCGRLAIYFDNLIMDQQHYKGYFVDVEYNRKQNGMVKTIIDDDKEVIPITCDLIIHSRGKNEIDNLIAIEMKKCDRPADEKEQDRRRLRLLTRKPEFGEVLWEDVAYSEHVCGYLLGVYIELDRFASLCKIEFYKEGLVQSKTELKI